MMPVTVKQWFIKIVDILNPMILQSKLQLAFGRRSMFHQQESGAFMPIVFTCQGKQKFGIGVYVVTYPHRYCSTCRRIKIICIGILYGLCTIALYSFSTDTIY